MSEIVYLTESIRLFPDKVQEAYFHKAASITTHVYNKAKEWDDKAYEETGKRLGEKELIARLKEYAKELEDKGEPHGLEYHTWREGVFRYIKARDRAFRGLGGFPRFQSNKWKVKKSFHVREDTLRIDWGTVSIPGMFRLPIPKRNKVRCSRGGRRFFGFKPKSARIIHDGKYWFLRYVVETTVSPEESYSEPIGVDLGLKSLLVTSDGRFIDPIWNNKKYDKMINRKKGLQRKLSRKRIQNKKDGLEQPSNNYWKTLNKLRIVERHINEFKKAFRVRVSKEVLKNNPKTLVIESLNVKGMLQNKKLSSKIHEVGWSYLTNQLEWEQKKKMGKVIKADRFFPSSKKCSQCGNIREKLALSERVYACPECSLVIDRDLNAALNLKGLAYA